MHAAGLRETPHAGKVPAAPAQESVMHYIAGKQIFNGSTGDTNATSSDPF